MAAVIFPDISVALPLPSAPDESMHAGRVGHLIGDMIGAAARVRFGFAEPANAVQAGLIDAHPVTTRCFRVVRSNPCKHAQ